jgi:hypothetical protein
LHAVPASGGGATGDATQDSARIMQRLCPHSEVTSRKGRDPCSWQHKCVACNLTFRVVWSNRGSASDWQRADMWASATTASVVGDSTETERAPPAVVCEVFTTGATLWLIGASKPTCSGVARLSRAAPLRLPSQMMSLPLSGETAAATSVSGAAASTSASHSAIQVSCWPYSTAPQPAMQPSMTSLSDFAASPLPSTSGCDLSVASHEKFLGVLSSDHVSREEVASLVKDVYAPPGLNQRHAFDSALAMCTRGGVSLRTLRSALCHDDCDINVALASGAGDGAPTASTLPSVETWPPMDNDVRCVVGLLRCVEQQFGVSYSVQRTFVDECVSHTIDASASTGGGSGSASCLLDSDRGCGVFDTKYTRRRHMVHIPGGPSCASPFATLRAVMWTLM